MSLNGNGTMTKPPPKKEVQPRLAGFQFGALPLRHDRIQPCAEEVAAKKKKVRKEGVAWAKRNGFHEPISVEGVAMVDYPLRGWGYGAVVMELEGKKRRANLVFTKEGKPGMWTSAGASLG